MRRRRILLAAAVALVVGGAASPAQAQVAWQPCTDEGYAAFECGRTTVPLDRSGGVPGTIDLFARRLIAPSNPGRTALVYLSGGPGQPATASSAQAAVALAPGLAERDLLVFDQRGTGASGALECDAVRQNLNARRTAASCANELGPRRGFFRTEDSVADIEDLRAAGGYERLVLYGVSYGTKVALAYAARHPARVESLVLDSTVTPEGPDPLRRSSFAASGRVLTQLCGEGRCRGVTPNPAADVRRLLRRSTIRGRYVTAKGRIRPGRLRSTALYDVLEDGDLNPAWRALLPGAMRAAAQGDESPLLRLASSVFARGGSAAAARSSRSAQIPNGGVNRALYLATVCEEIAFPWDRAAGPEARLEQAVDALNDVPADAFAPFNRTSAARASLIGPCYGWPNATAAPQPASDLPRVPALVLAGEADLRTPVEDAVAVAGRLGATAVAVPHTGHSVLGGDFSGCARAAVAAFFRDGSTPPCPAGSEPFVSPVRRPPRSLRQVPVARAYKGRVGRTLNAVALTQHDALVAALAARLDGTSRVAGVRRGTIEVGPTTAGLRGVELVPGVRVSGDFTGDVGEAHLRIRGRAAARGRLTVGVDGSARGVLGGKRINARPRAAAATATGTGPFGGPPGARRLVPFPSLVAE